MSRKCHDVAHGVRELAHFLMQRLILILQLVGNHAHVSHDVLQPPLDLIGLGDHRSRFGDLRKCPRKGHTQSKQALLRFRVKLIHQSGQLRVNLVRVVLDRGHKRLLLLEIELLRLSCVPRLVVGLPCSILARRSVAEKVALRNGCQTRVGRLTHHVDRHARNKVLRVEAPGRRRNGEDATVCERQLHVVRLKADLPRKVMPDRIRDLEHALIQLYADSRWCFERNLVENAALCELDPVPVNAVIPVHGAIVEPRVDVRMVVALRVGIRVHNDPQPREAALDPVHWTLCGRVLEIPERDAISVLGRARAFHNLDVDRGIKVEPVGAIFVHNEPRAGRPRRRQLHVVDGLSLDELVHRPCAHRRVAKEREILHRAQVSRHKRRLKVAVRATPGEARKAIHPPAASCVNARQRCRQRNRREQRDHRGSPELHTADTARPASS
mmetsp:Transcript_12843/g.34577  ORF Transcript_12843/g.34577 Transcript_12843/m.34577 type:complete len:440 (-) Transcript_12843:88-1407(-)